MIDIILPSISQELQAKQATTNTSIESKAKYALGDSVFATSYNGTKQTWVPAKVTKVCGPRSFEVTLENGLVWNRHMEQLKRNPTMSNKADTEIVVPEMVDQPRYNLRKRK